LGAGFDIVGLGPRNTIQVAGCKDFGALVLGCMHFDDKVDNVGSVCVGLGEGWCSGCRWYGIFDSCDLIIFRLPTLEVFDENKIVPTLVKKGG